MLRTFFGGLLKLFGLNHIGAQQPLRKTTKTALVPWLITEVLIAKISATSVMVIVVLRFVFMVNEPTSKVFGFRTSYCSNFLLSSDPLN